MIERLFPRDYRIDRALFLSRMKLKDTVIAVSMAADSGKKRPVCSLTAVVIVEPNHMVKSFEIETDRDGFILRFAIHRRFRRIQLVIVLSEQSVIVVIRSLGRLIHIEIKPLGSVEIVGR